MRDSKFESYFSMSLAYLEIGRVATEHEDNTGEYQNAVAYQLYHALELFVKYAILRSKGSVKPIHNFTKLFDEYYQLYPDDTYRIKHPFDCTSHEPCELNIGEKDMHEKHIDQFKLKIMDQHLRYPSDHKIGRYSFKIDSDYFTSTKDKFFEIYSKINR